MLYIAKRTKENMPALLMWTGFSVVAKVALPVAEMYLPRVLIDELTGGSALSRILTVAATAAVIVALLGGFDKFCERNVYNYKNQMGIFYIREVSLKGIACDYANAESEEFRSLQQESFRLCANNESTLRNVYYAWIGFISGIIGFAVFSTVLATLDAVVLLFLSASAAAGYLINIQVVKWAAENNAERAKYHRKLGYIDDAADDIKSAKDIRLYKMGPWFQKLYEENIEKIAKWYGRYDRLVIKTSFAGASVSLLREGAAYAYLIYLAYAGKIGAGEFILYFAAITGFSGWLESIFAKLTEMKTTGMYVGKFRRYLDFPDKFKRAGGVSARGKPDAPRKIELTGVSYRYGGAEGDALRDINLVIEPGEHLGVVGLNGAGKTTLVKIICGLVDPTDGGAFYGGVNIKEYNRAEFYGLFSAVFQQHSLLPLSVAEAVAEARPGDIDRGKVKDSLSAADLWEKVSSLPDGADSLLDKSVNDDAVVFSGGETQKLLLARAVYRDAPVLILDEPTAALDPVAENRLYKRYHELTRGKTSVFISHRLAGTRFCDRVILVDNGAIAETGTHAELLEKGGLYSVLYETQAKYYRENADTAENS